MNNEFKNLLTQYQSDWETVTSSETLEQLQDTYTNAESSRDEAINWIFEQVDSEEEQAEYFNTFGQFETDVIDNGGTIPIFDETFDIYESFDEYEAYYQRYGCMTPEYVVSWDGTNILFDDTEGNIEIIARPDVLMNAND